MKTLVLALLLFAATAVAAAAAPTSGYTLRLKAPFSVSPGSTVTVRAGGSAAKRSVLNIFLDRKTCAVGAQQESARYGSNGNVRPGDSYFVSPEGARVRFYSVPVRGGFARQAILHGGTIHESEHLCGYLNVLDAPTPASVAHTSRTFTVR